MLLIFSCLCTQLLCSTYYFIIYSKNNCSYLAGFKWYCTVLLFTENMFCFFDVWYTTVVFIVTDFPP